MFMTPPPPPVTVWIHGTRMVTLLGNFSPETQRKFDALSYSPDGLHAIKDLKPESSIPQLAHLLDKTDKAQFPCEHFYSFGWSGKLDPKERSDAAESLATSLHALIQTYQQAYNQTPSITLITHSHGGNVALNLAYVAPDLSIDRLILLACPVQYETSSYVFSTQFKKIYAIHSHADMVQILDPQRTYLFKAAVRQAFKERSLKPLFVAFHQMKEYTFFSQRHFDANSPVKHIAVNWEVTIPWQESDLILFPSGSQGAIRTATMALRNRHPVLHIEFLLAGFVERLPSILAQSEKHKGEGDQVIVL